MNKLTIVTLLFMGLISTAVATELGPLIAQCDDCHGVDGVSQWDDMPTIAGVSEFVLSDAMFFYQDNARPCRQSDYRLNDTTRAANDMCEISSGLTNNQIDVLAAYYAGKPFVAANQAFDTDLAARGRLIHDQACGRCHTDGGANAEDDAGLIKGQWMGYLRQTFDEYKAGTREQPEKMKSKLDELSDDDIEALIHFYASPD